MQREKEMHLGEQLQHMELPSHIWNEKSCGQISQVILFFIFSLILKHLHTFFPTQTYTSLSFFYYSQIMKLLQPTANNRFFKR